MNIAITSKGLDLDSEMDPRFGRAAYIIIYDSETKDFKALNNSENANLLKGAGIQAASLISEHDAEVLITGYCGPNAVKTLKAAKIKVVMDMKGVVKNALEKFGNGECAFTEEANVEGHWV